MTWAVRRELPRHPDQFVAREEAGRAVSPGDRNPGLRCVPAGLRARPASGPASGHVVGRGQRQTGEPRLVVIARGVAMSAEAVDPAGRERKEIQGDPNVGARQARRSSPNLTSVRIRNRLFDMRTTLDIPEELIEEARKLLGFKSKTDTIVLSLRELVRRKRIEQIKEILGSIDLEINLGDSRRRPRPPRSR